MTAVQVSNFPAMPPHITNIAAMIETAEKHPPKAVITGLFNEHEIVGLHGPREVFKTMLCLELAEAIASGVPFVGTWKVPQARSVYLLETEMSPEAVGERLRRMYAVRRMPSGVYFASKSELRCFRRAVGLDKKFQLLNSWVNDCGAEVVIIDTANPFFRGKESANEEAHVGHFFDLLEAAPGILKIFVRHDRKPRLEDALSDSAEHIRGSSQFGDVPDALFQITRKDKRINEAVLSITKFRHGDRPPDVPLWFDVTDFRLISIPPVVYLLLREPLTRQQLLAALDKRFHVSARSGDSMISAESPFLIQKMIGHERAFQIDWIAAKDAPWFAKVTEGYGG
ncbi:MAG: AAA family ATPase [Terriglobia bacterium]